MKVNCWEKMQCGCQPGGDNTAEHGVCPVSIETRAHWIHGGINGGRACWAIQRTLKEKNVQCKLKHNLVSCIQCEFYSQVREEEGNNYLPPKEIFMKLGGT